MASFVIFALALPLLVFGDITIKIEAEERMTSSHVHVEGLLRNIMSEKDIEVFGTTDNIVRKAIFKIKKSMPDQVFLKEPTPWNLYNTYKWKPVEKITKYHSSNIINVITRPETLQQRNVTNAGTHNKNESVVMKSKVENKITNMWNINDISNNGNISYKVELKGSDIGDLCKFDFVSELGKEFSESLLQTTNPSQVDIPMNPRVSAVVALMANKVTMYVEIKFVTILTGHVVTNNEAKVGGHHFWSYDIGSVLKAANLPQSIISSQVLKIEFYNNLQTVVFDK